MKPLAKGWTLIELVASLVVVGLVSVLLSMILQKPMQTLFYFSQTLATTTPIVWVDYTITQRLKGSKIKISDDQRVLRVLDREGGEHSFTCNQQAHTLSLDAQGLLLNAVDCTFKEQKLEGGSRVMLSMVLKDKGKSSARIERIYYVHPS